MQLNQINVVWIIILISFVLFAILLFYLAMRGQYTYKFEEKTIKANYLEEARRKLSDYRSPLIDTNDPAIF